MKIYDSDSDALPNSPHDDHLSLPPLSNPVIHISSTTLPHSLTYTKCPNTESNKNDPKYAIMWKWNARARGHHLNGQRAEDASTHQPNLRVSCSNPIKWLEIFIACSSYASLLIDFEEFVMRKKKNLQLSRKFLFAYLNSSGRMNAFGWMCLEYSLFLQITDDREAFLISANWSELTNQLIFVEFCYADLE